MVARAFGTSRLNRYDYIMIAQCEGFDTAASPTVNIQESRYLVTLTWWVLLTQVALSILTLMTK